ncbi:long-chain-fatty-acid--CoA ligase [Desulfosarcina alkanivorans]|uniref:Long-chain-fatty-acid--CoA ligase n=1 Tax=Desulfosarcina alkanivorans TaxID=571177 RepID=A0A5K7YKK2_9BACT|nr:class I adenylate-forming enzyme family protein [Desulfosarcina alkanivorans]BBO69746.1 long-chain-fatty-acid--CoA ligase [Desulfosarcina alkanivorans]
MKMDKSIIKFEPNFGVYPPKPLPNVPAYTILTESAKAYPDKVALVCCGKEVTYHELDQLSDRLAWQLSKRFHIGKGDRVATMMPNSIQHSIALFAVLKIGAVMVPCNVMYKHRELRYQLKDSEARVIIALDVFHNTIEAARQDTAIETVVLSKLSDFTENDDQIPALFHSSKEALPDGCLSLVSLLEEGQALNDYAEIDTENDLALLLYTAGTTGVSKGVMEAHRNLWACTSPTVDIYGFTENDVNLQIMPMFHCSGYCLVQLPMLFVGGTVVHVPLFEPQICIELINKYKITTIFAPPTFFVGLMNTPGFENGTYPDLKTTLSCGAPQPDPVRLRWEEITGKRLLDGYGMTESMCQGSGVLSMPNKYRPGAIGGPFNCKVKVVDSNLEIVSVGTVGEIMFNGEGVAKGYWNKPEQTKDTFLEDGWLKTGDAGYIDEDGYVYFVDRYKDLIVTSGYNVAPAEVESVLMAHSTVKEAAVIGVKDEYKGEVVTAFISVMEESKNDVSLEDIFAFCKERMATFKVPKKIVIVDEIPKNAVGKIMRRELREAL